MTEMDPKLIPTQNLMQLLYLLNNGMAEGSGINALINICHNLIGPTVPQVLVEYNIIVQNNLFGGYPDTKDTAPSAIFAACFGLIGIIYTILFIIDTSRGHYFYITIGWIIYSVMKMIGFVLRAVWSRNATLIAVGLTSEFFLIIPFILIVTLNLILAQRLFTWRHPVGGSRWLFWNFMFALYGIVIAIIVVIVLASYVPYLDPLSEKSMKQWRLTVAGTSILVVAYVLTSIALIGLSYFFSPTKKDENLYTYQPWWINSFAPLYFPEKGAAQRAEDTFMKRNHNHRHAIRVIAATKHHANTVEGLSNERGDLTHNMSIVIVTISTTLIFVGVLLRAVVCFQYGPIYKANTISKPVTMYICWGLFEVIIHVIYIVGRVDLRFYRPDVLPQKVRDIITAEQSFFRTSVLHSKNPSDVESEASGNEERSLAYPEDDEYDFDDHDKFVSESESSLFAGQQDAFDFKPRDEKDYHQPFSTTIRKEPPYPVANTIPTPLDTYKSPTRSHPYKSPFTESVHNSATDTQQHVVNEPPHDLNRATSIERPAPLYHEDLHEDLHEDPFLEVEDHIDEPHHEAEDFDHRDTPTDITSEVDSEFAF